MASVDKAAIGWSIAIVAAGVGIAMAGMGGGLPESPSFTAPAMDQPKSTTDPFADKAQDVMSQQEEREKAIAAQLAGQTGGSVTTSQPRVEDVPAMTGPTTVTVSMPEGTSVPGCEETDACYIPMSVSINVGDTVAWSNDDTAAHTVTSGSPTDGPDGLFDSSLVMAGDVYEVTFDAAGSYDYFCMVHPWMVGDVQVG